MKQNCVLYTIIYRKNCKTQTKMINNIKKVLHCIVHYDMMQTVQKESNDRRANRTADEAVGIVALFYVILKLQCKNVMR